jgi:hypothetical protein
MMQTAKHSAELQASLNRGPSRVPAVNASVVSIQHVASTHQARVHEHASAELSLLVAQQQYLIWHVVRLDNLGSAKQSTATKGAVSNISISCLKLQEHSAQRTA